jgi:hypothetical protein
MSFPLIPSVDIGGGIRRSPLFKDELQSIPYPEEPEANTTCELALFVLSFHFSHTDVGHVGRSCDEAVGPCVS